MNPTPQSISKNTGTQKPKKQRREENQRRKTKFNTSKNLDSDLREMISLFPRSTGSSSYRGQVIQPEYQSPDCVSQHSCRKLKLAIPGNYLET
jgi:uncharacterized UBP type Zn finger protein